MLEQHNDNLYSSRPIHHQSIQESHTHNTRLEVRSHPGSTEVARIPRCNRGRDMENGSEVPPSNITPSKITQPHEIGLNRMTYHKTQKLDLIWLEMRPRPQDHISKLKPRYQDHVLYSRSQSPTSLWRFSASLHCNQL